MNLSAIQAFVLISELGSISGAAKEMKKNRVLVSQWISALEDEWNVQLLDRSKQKPTLTTAGKNLLTHCKHLLDSQNKLRLMANQNSLSNNNKLKLGISYLIPPELIGKIVMAIKADFPELNIVVIQLRDEQLAIQEADQTLDICVLCYMNSFSVPSQTKQVGSLTSHAVCVPDFAMAKRSSLNNKDLLMYTWISMPILGNISLWEPPGITKRIEANNIQLAKQLVLQGAGFSTLPYWLIDKELDRGELVVLNHAEALVTDKVGIIINANWDTQQLTRIISTTLINSEYC